MKFVTAVVVALCWTSPSSTADATVDGKPDLLKQADDVLVPDLVIDKDEGSNPNQSTVLITEQEAASKGILQASNNAVSDAQSFKLRASATAATLNKQLMKASVPIRRDDDKSELVSAAADAIRGSAALMEEAKMKSEVVVAELQNAMQQQSLDGVWSEDLVNTYQSAIDQADQALEMFPKMLSYLEKKEESPPELVPPETSRGLLNAGYVEFTSNDELEIATVPEDENLLGESVESPIDSSASSSSKSSSSCKWDGDELGRHHKKEATKHRRILRSHVEGSSHGTTHFDRVGKVHQSLEAGDHASLHRHLTSIKNKVSRSTTKADKFHENRRRLNANLNKAQQCKIFMECVGQMTIYDMILYYYSDDIDDTSGDIDDNIYRHISAPSVYEVYNNANVVKARNNFPHNRAVNWYNTAGQRTWCDNTLRLFFRNVEYGAVPHWEGATVSAVCLAQGSHTYVKLDEIATKVGFQAADEIAEEMFTCSKDLYNSYANPRKSPFPFTTQKIGINAGASSVVETNGNSGGVTGRITGTLDSKFKIFDGNTNTFFRSRDGDRGYPMQLKIRSDQSRCVQWDDGSSDDYLRGWSCNGNNNKQKWFYDKRTKQIRSRHDQNDCMQAKSSGGNDKIRVRDCDSGDGHQRWTEYADYGIKNERRNKCMQKGGDHSMYVRGCDNDQDQDFLQVHENNFFTKMIPPSVEFRVQFSVYPTNVEIKAIEIKWKNGEECPKNSISMKESFNGGAIAFTWGTDSLSGNVNTWTAIPSSTTTTNRFRIFCNNPHKRIAVYEIVVYGSLAGGTGTLPKFAGTIDEFHAPTGVETGTNSRDNYGQVKGQGVTLYKYEDGPVKDLLAALKTTMVGTMKKIWDHWLKNGSDNLRLTLRTRYTNPYNNDDYKNSDDFIRMAGEAEDDDDIKKEMVAGFSRQTRGSYNSANYDDREEEFDEFTDDVKGKYGNVQDGFNMVFGKDASVGYVCGIESAVTKGDKATSVQYTITNKKTPLCSNGSAAIETKYTGTICATDTATNRKKIQWTGMVTIAPTNPTKTSAQCRWSSSGKSTNWKNAWVGRCGVAPTQFPGLPTTVDQLPSPNFPGSCCLDAPFQNPGGEWGREFDCTMNCITPAPFFSGLSEESCSAIGGTWCAGPTNCIVLKNCIDSEISSATTANKMAYVAYLEPGKVENHLDFDDCGNSREYFGFDELYKNDDDVCDNIKQLANTKDFDFLDEVYAQGTPLTSSPGGDWESLKEVDTKLSQSNMVQDGPVKFGLMYGLGIIRDTVSGYVDAVSEFKCVPDPEPPAPPVGSICATISNIAYAWVHVLKVLLELAYNAWEYTHAVTDNTSNIEPVEDWEVAQVQPKNNKIMHAGAKKIYEITATMEYSLIGKGTRTDDGKIGEILDCLKEGCETSRFLMSTGRNTQFAGCDGHDQDGDKVIDNCEEDHFPPHVTIPSTLAVKDDGKTKLVTGTVFQSLEDAVSTLRGALSVVDDCAGKEDLALDLTVKETNEECQAHVAAAPIHWCNDVAYKGQTEDFSVTVDSKPPVISCGFQSSTDESNKKILFVEEGDGFFDAGLSLQVEDSCADKVDVQVSVMSNEFDTTGPSAILALAENKGKDSKTTTTTPNLFLKQTTCSGQKSGEGLCQKSPIGSRVYKVSVQATDAAGWSASDTCHVVVTPPKEEVSSSETEEQRELLVLEQAGKQRKLESINYVHQF